MQAQCLECGASYEVKKTDEPGKVQWFSTTVDFPCRGEGCTTVIPVWRDQIRAGAIFECPMCTKQYIVQLVAMPMSDGVGA